MIEVRNLMLSRGSRKLFNCLSFSLESGSGLKISGPNGVGKSSLIAAILGEIATDAGEILINHKNLLEYSDNELFKVISVMPQSNQSISQISVEDLLHRLPFLNATDAVFIEFGIDKLFQIPIQKLSGGQLQKLFFAISYSKSADIYIFDEPISNQDEAGKRLIEAKIQNLLTLGKIVILVSHLGFEFLPSLEIKPS
jgi:iron complex transport system ATP-binding protein